ncbi:hypothetical protein GRJ2_001723200 [Grus japonensis]|uniref:SGNH hydrolase-type esterase domain-containing protein n=1 Tax=Grus japonensis TaxID=30415 RepID=A0ABC9X6F7_GRUJA
MASSTDMGRGRALPAPRLDPALELTWHPRGPQRAKYKAETGKRSQQSSEDLKEILKELDKAARELDRETVEEEALQEGGSQAVPVSDEKKGAIQSTGVPVEGSNVGRNRRTQSINTWLCGWCQRHNFEFFDNGTAYTAPGLMNSDRIHLSQRGKRIFAQELARLIDRALN